MKKWVLVVLCCLFLTGCAAAPVFETVADEWQEDLPASAGEIQLELPPDAAVLTDSGTGKALYFCADYCFSVQILPGGDRDTTLREVTGFEADQLTLVDTDQGTQKREDFVWTCAGEGQEQLFRGCILDDGFYHYVLLAQTDADSASAVQGDWERLFQSFWVV